MSDARIKIANDKKIDVILEFLPKIVAEMQKHRSNMSALMFLANKAKLACATLEIGAYKQKYKSFGRMSFSIEREVKKSFDNPQEWDYKTHYPKEGE